MLPSHSFLIRRGIPYAVKSFPPSTQKGAANVAAIMGLQENQTVKTLIFSTDKEEQILVMVGGNKNVVSGYLKKVVGSRNIQLASPETVIRITGYQIGSIPPFSWQPNGFRSFLDYDLMCKTILGVGAGVWGNEILITPPNLLNASSAVIVNLTNRDLPIYIQN